MSLRKGNTLISGAGIDGTNGQDGVSPTASVSKVGNVSTLTVVDANGTTTTQILDGGQTIQYSTVPTASSSLVGEIIQYIGTTDSTYTNGYFYKCVENAGTYSWENVAVQEKPTTKYYISGDFLIYNITPGQYNIAVSGTGQSSTYLPREELGEALTLAYNNNKKLILFIISTTTEMGTYFLGQSVPSTTSSSYALYGKTINGAGSIWRVVLTNAYTYSDNKFSVSMTVCQGNNLLTPGRDNSFSYTPSSNSYQPATTKYVDNKILTYTGYDASKTQTLKNVNGTLTWVDD